MSNIIVENPNLAAGTIIKPGMNPELDAAIAAGDPSLTGVTVNAQGNYEANGVEVTSAGGTTKTVDLTKATDADKAAIKELAELTFLAQTTGVDSNKLNASYEKLGLDTKLAQEVLAASGYTPGITETFFNGVGGYTGNDEGIKILIDRYNDKPTDEDLIAAGLDPLEYTVVRDNAAEAFYVEEKLKQAGLSSGNTNAIMGSTAGYLAGDLGGLGSQGATNVQDIRNAQDKLTGTNRSEKLLDIYEWDLLKKKLEKGDDITTGADSATGLPGSGIGGTAGAGGISGNFTNEQDPILAVNRADMPGSTGDFTSNLAMTTPGPSGTYTVPAQTFGSNVDSQVNALTEREEETAKLYQPQTIAEKEAAGQDVSAYQITQKLYRNPNTGAQLYIAFQGEQPLQPIPAGYIEVQQSGELVGAANIFNPLTAGGNTYTSANQGGYISGFTQGGDNSYATGFDPKKIYGNVSFQDPVTGQVITQTGPEYLQSLANRAGQATFNPATMATMPGTAKMFESTSPGTVLESTAGQALATAPLVTGTQLAQVSDISQAKGPGTPEVRDEEGNVISEAVAVPTSTDATVKAAAPVLKTELESFDAQTQAAPSDTIVAQTQLRQKVNPDGTPAIDAEGNPIMETFTSTSDLDAATQEKAKTVAEAQGEGASLPTRTLDTTEGKSELIEGTGVDQSKVDQAFGTGEIQAASVQTELANLMSQFDDGKTPAWAAGSMRRATAIMAQRGLGASSLAGQAIIQAAMEAALPIAQIDAGNKQQMALLKAEQRAKFLQIDFDQAFQRKVTNAAKISEIANINFSADQQIALENSRAAQTIDLTNLNNKQALIMAEAAALSQVDMANLTNLQQAAVQNAQNFLQLDMANLNNEQSTALFKAQSVTNAMLSDTAQENAAEQFNAQNENQMTQFSSNLAAQVSQFNAAQQNAINQFNTEEANAILEFNSALQNQREMFNAQNYLAVAQANAKWRQNITTANTTAQNVANLTYAKEVNGLTQKTLDDYWMKERDIMSYAFKQSETAMDRAVRILLGEQDLQAMREKLAFVEDKNRAAFWSRLILGDVSLTDIFKTTGTV